MFECKNTNVTAVSKDIETNINNSLDSSLNSILFSNDDGSFESLHRLDSLRECEEYFNSTNSKEINNNDSQKIDIIFSIASEVDFSDISQEANAFFNSDILKQNIRNKDSNEYIKYESSAKDSKQSSSKDFTNFNDFLKELHESTEINCQRFKNSEKFVNEDTFVITSSSDRETSGIDSQKENRDYLDDNADNAKYIKYSKINKCQLQVKNPLKDKSGVNTSYNTEIIESGFVSGKNKKIMIDSSKINCETKLEFFNFNSYEKYDDPDKAICQIEIESGFTAGNNKKILKDVNRVNDAVFCSFRDEYAKIKPGQNTTNNIVESGFVTGNNKTVFIDKSKIQVDFYNNFDLKNKLDINQAGLNSHLKNDNNCTDTLYHYHESNYVESGFTTGNNKKICIDPRKINNQIDCNADVLHDSNYTNTVNDYIKSGFTTGNNKKICIDPRKINNQIDCNTDILHESNYTNTVNDYIESDFTTGNNKKICINPRKINNQIDCNIYLINEKNCANIADNYVESDFTTGNNKKICVDPLKINNKIDCNIDPMEDSNYANIERGYIQSGFKIDHNKKISIDSCEINEQLKPEESGNKKESDDQKQIGVSKGSIKEEELEQKCQETELESSIYDFKDDIKNNKFSKHQPIRRYNIPEKGHISKKFKDYHRMADIYKKVKIHYKKEEQEWIFNNFKWTWMHLFVNNLTENEDIYDRVMEIMEFKRKNERSILRRIVEGDDISVKFMTLGILSYNQNVALLFDGSYSLLVEIDRAIYTLLRKNNCTTGSKLYVFGSKLLVKEPTSIFDITVDEIDLEDTQTNNADGRRPGSFAISNDIYKSRCALKLFYNSVNVAPPETPLGLCKKISFLSTIRGFSMTGGVISALLVRVKKVIEYSYLVVYENYRNRTKNLQDEMEKIAALAEKTGNTFDPQSVKYKYYCKLLVEDGTGECLLTWWTPPEVKENEKFKLVFLKPVDGAIGKHITTVSQTYFEKI